MSERSVEPRVNSGLPTMGEPASFRVVGVAHEEGSTSLRMEYHFEGEACHCGNHADEPDACHQTIVLAYFVKPVSYTHLTLPTKRIV